MGRLSQHCVDQYNEIIKKYIRHLIKVKDATTQSNSIEYVLLYISYLIGDKAQKEAYVNYLLNIGDSQVLARLKDEIKKFFTDELCEQLNIAIT